MRSASRLADVSINTVSKLLEDAGLFCAGFHYAKAKNVPTAKAAPQGAGDIWTWTAFDADNKLIISWTSAAVTPDMLSRLWTMFVGGWQTECSSRPMGTALTLEPSKRLSVPISISRSS